MANDVQQGKVLGEFAAKQGVKTVAIVDDRTAYGQGLADEFKKAAEASMVSRWCRQPNTPTTRRPTSRPS
jgi:ABC-type branched-subunit amino acid transport system substrate-binding protein